MVLTRVAIAIIPLMMMTQVYGISIAARGSDIFRPIFHRSVLDSETTIDWQAVNIYVVTAERLALSWTNLTIWLALVFVFEFSWRIGRVVFRRPAVVKQLVASARLNAARC